MVVVITEAHCYKLSYGISYASRSNLNATLRVPRTLNDMSEVGAKHGMMSRSLVRASGCGFRVSGVVYGIVRSEADVRVILAAVGDLSLSLTKERRHRRSNDTTAPATRICRDP